MRMGAALLRAGDLSEAKKMFHKGIKVKVRHCLREKRTSILSSSGSWRGIVPPHQDEHFVCMCSSYGGGAEIVLSMIADV